MLCKKCNIRESKTLGSKFCNACFVKNWREKNPEKHKDITGKYNRNRYKRDFGGAYSGNKIRALKRDNFSCRSCGKNADESILQIHHIDGKGSNLKNSERNNKLNNLITLCSKCHCKVEESEGRRPHKGLGGKWSYKFDSCIGCHSTETSHSGKGLCYNCYEKTRREYKRVWREKRISKK